MLFLATHVVHTFHTPDRLVWEHDHGSTYKCTRGGYGYDDGMLKTSLFLGRNDARWEAGGERGLWRSYVNYGDDV